MIIQTGLVEIPQIIKTKMVTSLVINRAPYKYYVNTITSIDEFRNKFILPSNKTIYVNNNGSDSNNGLDAQTPLATLQKAISFNPSTIIFNEGIYNWNQSDFSGLPDKCNLVGVGNVIIGRVFKDLNFITDDNIITSTNCFNDIITHIFDKIAINNFGLMSPLLKVNNLLECKSTLYSFCSVNGVISINHPSITPLNVYSKLVIPIGGAQCINNFTPNSKYYLENINFIGNCDFKGVNGQVYINNCKFNYSGGDQLSLHNLKESIIYKSSLGYSLLDGIDYSNTNIGWEIDCKLTNHGQLGTSNQNSTGHNYSNIIRVGGLYHNAQDSNVYDTQGCNSLLAGCVLSAKNKLVDNGTNPPQANLVSGYNVNMWCDGVSIGGHDNVPYQKAGYQQQAIGNIFDWVNGVYIAI